jgi:hypothetical protein
MALSAPRFNFIVFALSALFLLRFFVNSFMPGTVISNNKNMPAHPVAQIEKPGTNDTKPIREKPAILDDLFAAAERGNTRAQAAAFIIMGGFIVWAIGSIFFIIEAFKISVSWGLFVLFSNGIAISVFSIRYWNRVKIPVFVYYAGIGIMIAGVWFAAGVLKH